MLAFNKKMAGDFGLDDVYKLVRDGKWSFDRYFSMCETVASDIDGDGKYTMNDRYGQVVMTNMHFPNFWLQSAISDTQGLTTCRISRFRQRRTDHLMTEIFDRSASGNITYNLYTNSDWKKTYDTTDNYNSTMMLFMAGNSLFVSASLTTIPVARSMETDFGIIPYPKSEETFAGYAYGSRTFGGFPYVVPITVTDTDMVSAIMEASACEAVQNGHPGALRSGAEDKSARDTDSEEMLT